MQKKKAAITATETISAGRDELQLTSAQTQGGLGVLARHRLQCKNRRQKSDTLRWSGAPKKSHSSDEILEEMMGGEQTIPPQLMRSSMTATSISSFDSMDSAKKKKSVQFRTTKNGKKLVVFKHSYRKKLLTRYEIDELWYSCIDFNMAKKQAVAESRVLLQHMPYYRENAIQLLNLPDEERLMPRIMKPNATPMDTTHALLTLVASSRGLERICLPECFQRKGTNGEIVTRYNELRKLSVSSVSSDDDEEALRSFYISKSTRSKKFAFIMAAADEAFQAAVKKSEHKRRMRKQQPDDSNDPIEQVATFYQAVEV